MQLRTGHPGLRISMLIGSWLSLVYVDLLMKFRGFPSLHTTVREQAVRPTGKETSHDALSHAMDLACVFYFKRVLCLQRSTALVLLLRLHGLQGEMVIGVQLLPFLSHAWVEAGGQVINDKPYISETFQVIERC